MLSGIFKADGDHTLSKRRCRTAYFPAPCFPISPVTSCGCSVPDTWFFIGGLRRRLMRVSPNILIWGTKAKARKLTLQRRCWMLEGKSLKVKRWENGETAAIPYLYNWKSLSNQKIISWTDNSQKPRSS